MTPYAGLIALGPPMTLTSTPTPHTTTMTLASPSMPHASPMTLASISTPRVALTTPLTSSSATAISPPAARSVPRMLRVGAAPSPLVVHLHPMRTYGAIGFWQPKLYIAVTLSPILKSVRVTLADPHWRVAMRKSTLSSCPTTLETWFCSHAMPILSPASGSSNKSSRLTGYSRGTRPARFFAGSRSVPALILVRLSAPL
jgi:hypothetical protein